MKGLLALFAAVSFLLWPAAAQDDPPLPFEIEPHDQFALLGPAWFDKGEEGWLFTVRVRAPSVGALRPAMRLQFEGLALRDEEELEASEGEDPYKVVWEKRQNVFRRDFRSNLNFVSVPIDAIPEDVEKLVLRFEIGTEGASAEQD